MNENHEVSAELDESVESEIFVESEVVEEEKRSTPLSTIALAILVLVSMFLALRVYALEEVVDDLTTIVKPQQASLYEPPADLEKFINKMKKSTVTVYCRRSGGAGWALDLDTEIQGGYENFTNEIITNHHVIEDCLDGNKITISMIGSTAEYKVRLYDWDKKEDLAILLTDREVKPLKPSPVSEKPEQGHWVLAIGSPGNTWYDMTGAVTTGRVTKMAGNVIVTDASINHGNSGGPLVNARGHVLGIVSWAEYADEFENISYANGHPALCRILIECEGPTWDW